MLSSKILLAADCVACGKIKNEILDWQINQRRMEALLHKNKEMLSQLGAESTSIKIKLVSNVFVTQVKIETDMNNIAASELEFTKAGCSKCQ